MYSLSKRQKEITCFIAEGKEFITVRKLAQKYGVSERSIHYDLTAIGQYLETRGAVLIRSRQNGVSMRAEKAVVDGIIAELMKEAPRRDIFSREERLSYILSCLYLSDKLRIRSDDIAEVLWISKPTVIADLRTVKERLSEKGILLQSKKGSGYWIEGNEIIIRETIQDYLREYFISKRITNYHSLYRRIREMQGQAEDTEKPLFEYLRLERVKKIYDTFNVLRRENGIIISDTDAFELFIYIVVMVNRNLSGFYIKEEDLSPDILQRRGTNRYLLARGIREQLETDFGLKSDDNEAAYLRVLVIMQNVSYRGSGIEEEDEHIRSAVKEGVDFIEEDLGLELGTEQRGDLEKDLYEALLLIREKQKLGIVQRHSLIAETEAEYPRLMELSQRLSGILKKGTELSLQREDMASIALTIAAYVDASDMRPRKKVLIICDKGRNESLLLRNRIRNNIPDINITATASVYDVDEHPELLSGVDFIISTAEIDAGSIPVFRVSPVISNADIRRINKSLSSEEYADEPDKDDIGDYILKNTTIDTELFEKLGENDRNELRRILTSLVQRSQSLVSRENVNAIKDEQAYLIARVMVNLGNLFTRVNEMREKPLSVDTMMGLVIHVALSTARWEAGRFFPHASYRPQDDYEASALRLVHEFLDSLDSIFETEISKDEAVTILRYLI